MLTENDFMIKSLGTPVIPSPFQFSTNRGDTIVDFTSDTERMPYKIKLPCSPEASRLSFEIAGPRKMLYFDGENVTAGIMTCGGLCPGLNNALRSIVMHLYYKYNVRRILGIRFGQKGLDRDAGFPPMPLRPDVVLKIHEMGGSFIGTSRGKVDTNVMVDSLVYYGINVLFCLGGDGTQQGLHAIHQEIERRGLPIAVVGLPKTIDNDINFVHKTFGLDSAVTVAKEVVRSAHCEAESVHNGIGLVKVMGRNSGFIAALTTLANNDVNLCLVPEVPFDLHGDGGLLDLLERRLAHRHHVVIVVAEGAGQEFFTGETATFDKSGNKKLGDIGLFLKDTINEFFALKKIPIDLKYIDPSYMIRSIPTNANDSIFAAELGRLAVDAAMAGKTDLLIGIWHNMYTHVPLSLSLAEKKRINPEGGLWRDVLIATGQPLVMTAK